MTRYVIGLVSHESTAGAPQAASGTAAGISLGLSSRRGRRGRGREWGVLAGILRAAGRGGALLVEGESGMGKSRLLGDAAEAARLRAVATAWGEAARACLRPEASKQAVPAVTEG